MEQSQNTGTKAAALPDIYSYLDYRTYLRDVCAAKKQQNPHFSYRYLSQKIKIKSAGFFSWVLQGKRNISDRLVLELAHFFRLGSSETAYFESLVAFNQATTHEERRHAFDKLLAMRRGSVKQMEADQCAFYRTWYYPALRELVAIVPVTDETASEAATLLHPAIKPSDVKEALLTLARLGLVRKDGNGCYERTDQVISSRENVPLVALHDYQISSLDLAKSAFDRFEKSERELSTVTMSVDNEAYLMILERLASLRREIMEIARSVKKPSRVMQLNLQYFPLSLQRKVAADA
jgi:uncharacterized protein (TIGR02147 family)